MPTQFTPAALIEVPLPADYQDNPCLPLVIMQPTADATNYMLKSDYATSGEPGIVDHALVADTVITIPQHGVQHLQTGDDPIPLAGLGVDGLLPGGTGSPTDYLGGDVQFRALPAISRLRSEQLCTLSAGAGIGSLVVGIIANPVPGVYAVDYGYLYDASSTPAGLVHFEVYDPVAAQWVVVTSNTPSTDISVMTSKSVYLRPIITSAAMQRVFAAGPNSLTWRLWLDQTGGVASSFQVGFAFSLLALQNL